jgi:hypothetical protein
MARDLVDPNQMIVEGKDTLKITYHALQHFRGGFAQ